MPEKGLQILTSLNAEYKICGKQNVSAKLHEKPPALPYHPVVQYLIPISSSSKSTLSADIYATIRQKENNICKVKHPWEVTGTAQLILTLSLCLVLLLFQFTVKCGYKNTCGKVAGGGSRSLQLYDFGGERRHDKNDGSLF